MRISDWSSDVALPIFAASFHDHCDPCDQIGCLHTNLGTLVVEPPFDCSGNLRQIWLAPLTESIHHCAKSRKHDLCVIGSLLLERIQDAINQLFLSSLVNISGTDRKSTRLNSSH